MKINKGRAAGMEPFGDFQEKRAGDKNWIAVSYVKERLRRWQLFKKNGFLVQMIAIDSALQGYVEISIF